MISKETPVVSVCMITYNHESYIAQAIEGVLIQKTNFPIELIIGEDCSTDSTRSICNDYQQKHPEIIKLQLPETNKGMMRNFIENMNAARGKYIALCEGDDYWTDPYKLQQQVEILNNSNYSACYHNCEIINEKGEKLKQYYPIISGTTLTTKMMIWKHYIPTASLLFRKELLNKIDFNLGKHVLSGDRFLELSLSIFGPISYIKKSMAKHRKHDLGITNSAKHQDKNIRLRSNLDLYLAVSHVAIENDKHFKIFNPKIVTSYLAIVYSELKNMNIHHAYVCTTYSLKYFLSSPLEFFRQRIFKIYR